MRVAFLEPLDAVAKDMPGQFLADHDVLIAPARDQLPDGYETAEAVVWSRTPVDAAFIDGLPNLRFMQRLGRFRAVGDASRAFEKGIPVSVFPHGTSGRVAEHTFALLIGLFRQIIRSHNAVVENQNPTGLAPEEQIPGNIPGLNWSRLAGLQSMQYKTIGIVGFGEIGAHLSLLLQPFNCRVLYNKRSPLTPEQESYFRVSYASFEDLMSQSDGVCDLVPVSEPTRGMFGEKEFALMKPTAYFVNTGRAWTTDEAALARALANGTIGGAGIDVFSYEPLQEGNPLQHAPKTLFTPHTAGGGGNERVSIGGLGGWTDVFERLRENLRRVEAKEPVLSPMLPTDPPPGGARA
jgi:phosphoglycerate dehydrogenase-like enzyme